MQIPMNLKRKMKNMSHTLEYYVIEGDKISMAEWGDYIGIAVTSTDFPVIGQFIHTFIMIQIALTTEEDMCLTAKKTL